MVEKASLMQQAPGRTSSDYSKEDSNYHGN